MYVYIPPALWARGGLEVVSIKSIKPSPYPLPGPPIRPVWISRGRTSFSPKTTNPPARGSKSTTETESSCSLTALLGALVWRFIYFRENEQNVFFMFFQFFPLRLLPIIARTTPKNPYVPHHFVSNSSGFTYKWTRMPRAIPPSKVEDDR